KLYGVPWYVDTRLLFYRTDLLAQAGCAASPLSWDELARALAAVKANAGPDRYSILLPLNEFDPLVALALQQNDPLLRDNGSWGNFERTGFRRALAIYLQEFQRGWFATLSTTIISNCGITLVIVYLPIYIS